MRQLILLLAVLYLNIACSNPKTKEMTATPSYSFLIGTYTDHETQGINLMTFNPGDKLITIKTLAQGVNNPSFVIADKEGKVVYSIEESGGVTGGSVLVLSLSETHDDMKGIDTVPSYGDDPCYLALSPQEDFLVAGNYSGGNLSIYRIHPDHTLKHLQTIQHQGSSINKDRQEKAHVHSTVFSPDGKHLLVADLGTDRIYTYAFDPSLQKPLSPVTEYPVTPGDGPRHIVFSPEGDEVAVIHELTAVVELFGFKEGELLSKQRLSMVAEDFEGELGAAEIRFSPDGQNLYASNRGDANTLSVFSKTGSGEWIMAQQINSGGKTPRNFNLTSDGNYLLAANQASDNIIIFERDKETGLLTPTDLKVGVNKPVYIHQLIN